MAPFAIILGGISGTLSAIFGWLLFGLTFWGAVQLYFIVSIMVATALIGLALMRLKAEKPAERRAFQRV